MRESLYTLIPLMVYKKYNASEPLCKSGNVEDHNTLETRQPGTKSSINGLGQHILMKGLLVREYLAPDANAIAVLGRSVSIGQQEQGSVQEDLVRRNKYYLWIILDQLARIAYQRYFM